MLPSQSLDTEFLLHLIINQIIISTYCKGANNPSSCGVDNTDLIANQNSKTVSVNKFPWRVVVSTQPNYNNSLFFLNQCQLLYLACSYHIYAEEYTWKQGSKLHLNISTFNDVKLYLYGGNSRENASHIILNNNNSTLAANQTYKIDVEVGDLMLLVLPIQGRTSATTYYTFSYQIHGENYSWWEQLIIGKNGRTYFIIAIASASLIFFLIAFGLVWCFIKWFKSRDKLKVYLQEQQNESMRELNKDQHTLNEKFGNKIPFDEQKTMHGSDQAKNHIQAAYLQKPWSPTNNNRHFGNSLDQTQNNQDNFLAKPQRVSVKGYKSVNQDQQHNNSIKQSQNIFYDDQQSKRSVAATFRKQTNQ